MATGTGKTIVLNLWEEVSNKLEKPDPPTFKVGRDAVLQLSKLERDLFTDIEEKESGNYIIKGLSKKVSELEFTAFTFAVGQILYNQSYKSGNYDINSGIDRIEAEKTNNDLNFDIDNYKKSKAYMGNIVVTLNELCRLAYGTEPTTEIKRKMIATIDAFDNNFIELILPNGDTKKTKLCVVMGSDYRKKDNAFTYHLVLNPIFGSRIKNQFGELPQDIIASLEKSCKKREQRKQAAHYLLIRWLSVQDKRKPFKRSIDHIINELRMEDYFKKNRSMAEKQIISFCKIMEDIGIVSSHEVEYRKTERGKRIESITFHLNPYFVRTTNETEKAPQIGQIEQIEQKINEL